MAWSSSPTTQSCAGSSARARDQRLLSGVDVLILIDDQVAQRLVRRLEHLGSAKLPDRPSDHLAEGQQAALLECLEVALVDRAEGFVELHCVKQLVFDHLEVLQEDPDRLEELVVDQFRDAYVIGLARQERGQPVVVEHVEGLIAWHVLLEEAEAVRVDGTDEHPSQPVEVGLTQSGVGHNTALDAGFERRGRALGKGEGDDAGRLDTLGAQRRDTLGDDLSLARSGRGDDLQVAATIGDGCLRLALKLWNDSHGCGCF